MPTASPPRVRGKDADIPSSPNEAQGQVERLSPLGSVKTYVYRSRAGRCALQITIRGDDNAVGSDHRAEFGASLTDMDEGFCEDLTNLIVIKESIVAEVVECDAVNGSFRIPTEQNRPSDLPSSLPPPSEVQSGPLVSRLTERA